MMKFTNGVGSKMKVVAVEMFPVTKEERTYWLEERDTQRQLARYEQECGDVKKYHISELVANA